jgi:hypothetical protein
MATNAQKSTAGRTVKAASASATAAEPASRPADQRAEPQAKAGQTKTAKPAAQQSRQAAQQPKRRPYHMEIAALADTTAELPSLWRQQAIHIVHTIFDLFKRAWRELRRRADGANVEAAKPTDDADPRPQN